MRTVFRYLLLLPVVTLVLSCSDTAPVEPYPAHPVEGDHSAITDPYERWKAYDLDTYVMVERFTCYCARPYGDHKVIVRNNKIVDVIRLEDGVHLSADQWHLFRTVDDLFTLMQEVQADTSAGGVKVRFDSRVGYPANLFIDYIADAIDDEITYAIASVEELR